MALVLPHAHRGFRGALTTERHDTTRDDDRAVTEAGDLGRRAAVSGVVALLVLVGSLPMLASRATGDAELLVWLLAPVSRVARDAMPWLFGLPVPSLKVGLFVLSLPAVLWAGRPLFAGAWRSVQRREADAMTLLGVGAAAAMLTSTGAALAPGLLARAGIVADAAFETATGIVTLGLVARLVEVRALARIGRIGARARASEGPAPHFAERLGGALAPVALGVAIAVFGLWLAVGPEPAGVFATAGFVTVLVVTCPAALGLGAPTAIRVGAGHGAECGVFVKGGDSLEAAAALHVVVLDKTGTVTEGKPIVSEVFTSWKTDDALNGLAALDENAVIRYAAAVERFAEHPLAAAVVREAGSRELTPPEAEAFEPRAGRGASAVVEGRHVAVGSAAFLIELGVDVGPFTDAVDTLAAKARTPVLVAVDGAPVGLLGLYDPIKPSAVGAVRQLKKMGLAVVLLTADVRKAAIAVAGEIGVDEVESGILPAGKVAVIRALQRSGRRVAFVGDGVTDAPALAAADVGIAIGPGADSAFGAADLVLASGDLRAAVTALELARRTMRTVRQNLSWALAYHALGLPIAAGLLYPAFGVLLSPLIAGAAMVLSSFAVLANSLRLGRFTPTFPT
ncbi:MAG: heavy metal translocating P-type ATPase [Gemmatimonadetes bacterium]|nr:heavy metal translocating P-type ATPase [Gemmatimonadota bacterium]